MFAAIVVLAFLPFLDSQSTMRSTKFVSLYQMLFWCFAVIFLCLGWLGANPAEPPFVIIGQLTTLLYFSFFLAVHDFGYFESSLVLNRK